MMKPARNGPAKALIMKKNVNRDAGRKPQSESTQGTVMIHENAYAMKKKDNKGCWAINCLRLLGAVVG